MKTPTLILIAGLALTNTSFAVDPPPDGGYPNNNTAEGDSALFSLTTGVNNTAIGFGTLFSNTSGSSNTAVGADALLHNTTASFNTAIGVEALVANTTGNDNTASGVAVLTSNTTGGSNTASGAFALYHNTTGNDNTADGYQTLYSNTTGFDDTAIGFTALFSNTTGNFNMANGSQALFSNTDGHDNTANGRQALFSNTDGFFNTATASDALFSNTSGSDNTAIGVSALNHNTSGSSNIALGFTAGANLSMGSNNIDIGSAGVAGESSTIRIGTEGTHNATYIAGIRQTPLASGTALAVGITADGQLGVRASSARFKDAIKPMDKSSEAILSLQPVTFRYKKALDPKATPQFGLVAEQVEKVDPDLVAKDDQGKPFTVRYEEVNAMLLNEFLKEHKKVENQGNRIEVQAKEITELKSALKGVTARLDAKGL